MSEKTRGDTEHGYQVPCDGMQVAQRTILPSREGTSEDADLQSMRNMQDSDGMNDWLAIQWGILRDAGLLNE